MKVEILPPSLVEAEKLDSKEGLAVKPLFYGKGTDSATAAVLKIYSEKGDLVFMGMIRVTGNGKPNLQDRTKAVLPALDRPKPSKSTSQ